jgi:hypothetical protein
VDLLKLGHHGRELGRLQLPDAASVFAGELLGRRQRLGDGGLDAGIGG